MSGHMVNWLGPWLVQSTVMAIVGLTCLTLTRGVPARVRLYWLQALLLATLVAPWLLALVEPIVPARPLDLVVFEAAEVTAQPAAPAGVTAPAWWLLVWVSGAAARGLWLFVGSRRIRRWRRAARPLVDGVFTRALALAGAHAPAGVSLAVRQPITVGVRQPTLLVPETLLARSDAERLAVYVHELRHVARRDLWMVWLEEAVRTLCWPLPALWLLVPRIRLAREEVVDVETVCRTGAVDAYVAALVWSADRGGPRPSLATAFLRRHQLLTRVASLTREVHMSRARVLAWSVGVIAALVLATSATSAIVPLAPTQGPPIVDGPGPLEQRAVLPTLDVPAPKRTLAVDPVLPAGAEGGATFRIHAVLDQAGTVAEARIVAPAAAAPALAGDPATRQAVIDAVRQWQFEAPAVAPMLVVTTVKVGAALPSVPAGTAVRVGGPIAPPRKVLDVQPVYPEAAKDAAVQGVVILETTIERTGDVSAVRVLRSIPQLDAAAVTAVRQWKYEPQEHRVIMVMTINFTLAADGLVRKMEQAAAVR